MNVAIVDIGSNTIRMNMYALDGPDSLELVASRKIMAGLACYISKKGVMEEAGIECLCSALCDIKGVLRHFRVDRIAAFATASLRNIVNSIEVLDRIDRRIGWKVEILSGETEARLGFEGIRDTIRSRRGLLVDIGGGSTEATVFEDGVISSAQSFNIGSLNLFKKCVNDNILPDQSQLKQILKSVNAIFRRDTLTLPKKPDSIVGIGGTARAILKLGRVHFGEIAGGNSLTADAFEELAGILFAKNKTSVDLIVRACAQRAHTIVPGMAIMRKMFELSNAKTLEICQNGLREGYLRRLISAR